MTGININAGFEVGSANPIDTRQWLSTVDMKNADVNTMPDPYFAINKEDHFLYIFSKTNPISESTGYFTKYTNDGGMTVWKGSEAERDALPEETRADESIIFYTWDTASAEYKNVVSKTVGTVENMSEADYQALETKDAGTIYATETGISVGLAKIATNVSTVETDISASIACEPNFSVTSAKFYKLDRLCYLDLVIANSQNLSTNGAVCTLPSDIPSIPNTFITALHTSSTDTINMVRLDDKQVSFYILNNATLSIGNIRICYTYFEEA